MEGGARERARAKELSNLVETCTDRPKEELDGWTLDAESNYKARRRRRRRRR